MNPEKLKKIQNEVRIGGKGTPRRKHKIVHGKSDVDAKQCESQLKKLPLGDIKNVIEVVMFMTDGTVLEFKEPKVRGMFSSNLLVLEGRGERKSLDMVGSNFVKQIASDLFAQQGDGDNKPKEQDAKETGGKASSQCCDNDGIPPTMKSFDEVALQEAEVAEEEAGDIESSSEDFDEIKE